MNLKILIGICLLFFQNFEALSLSKPESADSASVYLNLFLENKLSNQDTAIFFAHRAILLAEKEKNDSLHIAGLNELANLYLVKNEFDRADELCKKAELIARKNNLTAQLGKSLHIRGKICLRKGDYGESLTLNKSALEAYTESGNIGGMASVNNNIGVIYSSMQNFEKAFNYFLESLRAYRKLNQERGISKSLNNLGIVSMENNDPENALKYFEESIAISRKEGNLRATSNTLNNIALVFLDQKKYDAAKKYLNEALDICNTSGYTINKMSIFINLGVIYQKQGQINKAREFFEKSHAIAKQIGDIVSITDALINLAEIKYIQGEDKEALKNSDSAIKYSNETGALEQLKNSLSIKMLLASATGKRNEAFDYLEQINDLQDSLFTIKNSELTAHLRNQYDWEYKDREIENLKKESRLQALEIEKKENFQIFMVILFSFILVAIIIGIRSYKKLSSAHKDIKNKNALLRDRESKLTQVIAEKDKLFSVVSHDLKNPFNSLLGNSDFLLEVYNDMEDDERLEIIKNIRSASRKAYNLLEELLKWVASQRGRLKINKEVFNLTEEAEHAIYIAEESAETKDIELKIEAPKSILVNADKNMIASVIRNLLINAIKFSKKHSSIYIFIRQAGEEVTLSVKDNGIGMSKEEVSQLFKIVAGISKSGTENEKGTGLGLILCKDFVEKNEGKIEVESEPEKGSVFRFTLPLYHLA